jgi:hypothetical protein
MVCMCMQLVGAIMDDACMDGGGRVGRYTSINEPTAGIARAFEDRRRSDARDQTARVVDFRGPGASRERKHSTGDYIG